MRRPWPTGGAVVPKTNTKPPINIPKFNVFPDLTLHCNNKTIISHNSTHISALLNNLIVNTNNSTCVKNTPSLTIH
jgi:hypothetical protein